LPGCGFFSVSILRAFIEYGYYSYQSFYSGYYPIFSGLLSTRQCPLTNEPGAINILPSLSIPSLVRFLFLLYSDYIPILHCNYSLLGTLFPLVHVNNYLLLHIIPAVPFNLCLVLLAEFTNNGYILS